MPSEGMTIPKLSISIKIIIIYLALILNTSLLASLVTILHTIKDPTKTQYSNIPEELGLASFWLPDIQCVILCNIIFSLSLYDQIIFCKS